jgi:hypothetical protein
LCAAEERGIELSAADEMEQRLGVLICDASTAGRLQMHTRDLVHRHLATLKEFADVGKAIE